MIMLAYDMPAGRAEYIGGSGLRGEPQYTLGRRVLAHSAVCALAGIALIVTEQESIMYEPEDEDDDDEPAMEQEQIKDMFPDQYRDPDEDE